MRSALLPYCSSRHYWSLLVLLPSLLRGPVAVDKLLRADCVLGDAGQDYTSQLKVNLSRLIAYAESADTGLQREVAEKLANEAVRRKSSFSLPPTYPSHQKQPVYILSVSVPT